MGDIDPDTEALLRQLHRELNGLTRQRRAPASSALEKLAARHDTARNRGGRTGSKRKASSTEDNTDVTEDSDGRQGKKGRKDQEASHDGKPTSKAKAAPSSDAQHPRKVKSQHESQHKKQHQHQHEHADGIKAEPAAAVHGDAQQQPHVNVQPKTPLEDAALAASTAVRSRVRKSSDPAGPTGHQRSIKCFHAGVRWGITLAPDGLKTRSDLATALNDAFAGQILSCGRGDGLSIVFLDDQGRATEFPPLRSSGMRDSTTKWKVQVERAVRIYVRR